MTVGPVEPFHPAALGAVDPVGIGVVAVVALVPVLAVPYTWVAAEALMRVAPYRYRRAHDPAYYASFVWVVAVAVAVVAGPSFAPHAAALGAPAVGAVLYWVDSRAWDWWSSGTVRVTGDTPPEAVATLAGPPAEEVVYRGGLTVLLGWVGPVGYVVVSAALFGLDHYHLGRKEVALKTWNGAVYALLYLGTGTVLVPVVAHVAYNLVYLSTARVRTGRWIVRETDGASS